MALDNPVIRKVIDRVFSRKDVLDACTRRDPGAVITVLCTHGLTQSQLSVLTGIPQGRLSEYKTHKRVPTATSTFETFADGLGLPPAARRALGLAAKAAGSGPLDPAGGRSTDATGAGLIVLIQHRSDRSGEHQTATTPPPLAGRQPERLCAPAAHSVRSPATSASGGTGRSWYRPPPDPNARSPPSRSLDRGGPSAAPALPRA